MSIKLLQILSEFFILLSTNKKTINGQNILSLHKFINNKLEKIIICLPPVFKSNSIKSLKKISILKNDMNYFVKDSLKYFQNKSLIKINNNAKNTKMIIK